MGIFNIDVSKLDASKSLDSAATDPLPEGWYKIKLVSESEEKPAKSGAMTGAIFTYEVVSGNYSGRKFGEWRCLSVESSADRWALERSELLFGRIAQVLGVGILTRTSELLNRPFYAKLKVEKRERTVVDEKTGESKKRVVYNNAFCGVAAETILSVAEYVEKTSSDSASAPESVEGGAPKRRIVKASRVAAAVEPVATGAGDSNDLPF